MCILKFKTLFETLNYSNKKAYNLNIVYHVNSFRELNTNIKSCDSLVQMIIERKQNN